MPAAVAFKTPQTEGTRKPGVPGAPLKQPKSTFALVMGKGGRKNENKIFSFVFLEVPQAL